jgi:hypothetical protein
MNLSIEPAALLGNKNDVFVGDFTGMSSSKRMLLPHSHAFIDLNMPAMMANSDQMNQFDFFTLTDDGHLENLSPAMLSSISTLSPSTEAFLTPISSKPASAPVGGSKATRAAAQHPYAAILPSPNPSPNSDISNGSSGLQPLTNAQKAALASVQEAQLQRARTELQHQGIDTSGLSVGDLRVLASQLQSVDSQAATELRRQMHIQSEQKRRAQIKDGFEELKAELPGYQNKKMSKALILAKTLDFVRQIKQEREVLLGELERLRMENEAYRAMHNNNN